MRDVDTRRRWTLTGCSAGLTVVVLVLAALAADSGDWSVGLLGMVLLVAAFVLLTVDAWWRLPRPAPRRRGEQVVVPSSRLVGVLLVAFAVGVNLVYLSFTLEDGLLQTAREARQGSLLLVGAPVAPLLLIGAVVLAARPGRIVLDARAVAVRRVGFTTRVPWDQLQDVDAPEVDVIRLWRVEGRPVGVPVRFLGLDGDRLVTVLHRYRADPAARRGVVTDADLVGPQGIEP